MPFLTLPNCASRRDAPPPSFWSQLPDSEHERRRGCRDEQGGVDHREGLSSPQRPSSR